MGNNMIYLRLIDSANGKEVKSALVHPETTLWEIKKKAKTMAEKSTHQFKDLYFRVDTGDWRISYYDGEINHYMVNGSRYGVSEDRVKIREVISEMDAHYKEIGSRYNG